MLKDTHPAITKSILFGRPELSANQLCLLVAAWIVLTANHAFWSLLFSVDGVTLKTGVFTASLVVSLIGLNLFVLRLLSPGRSVRLMLSLLLLVTAVSSWCMDIYGVGIDSEMLRNAVQTNLLEAEEFLGWSLEWRVLWQAVLPMVFIWRVVLPPTTWSQAIGQYVGGVVLGLVLLFAAALPDYVAYASFFRNQTLAQHLIVPSNVIRAGVRLVRKDLLAHRPYEVVGMDATRRVVPQARPLLTVLVVGETARAANFSLGGYARLTNPQLQQREVLYFSNVHSCGTATAMSVPCMFSDLPRAEFDLNAAEHRDTVLDVLQRAGLAVSWVDNQSGCKGVCERIPHEEAGPYQPSLCTHGECQDGTLLPMLDRKLLDIKTGTTTNRLLVLHQMGSHGPAYHLRVPTDQVMFTPTCATDRIETCTTEQIVNAYDNTIAYTDAILAGLIDRLQHAQDRLDSVLIYVSDHGESLGEGGLYLHGQPYVIAPDVQKHVPMLMWFSAGAPTRLGLDMNCLRHRLQQPYSHDNLSHTLIGLNDVRTRIYRPQLDMLHDCRSNPSLTSR